MSSVRIFGNPTCAYCGAARMLFAKKGVAYDDINIAGDADKRSEMERLSGRRSVPQIFIGDRHIGGFEDLCALDKSGELNKLLADI